MGINRVAVLVTSFNRREQTLAALSSLFRQRGIDALDLVVFLVDDGSVDGTGDAVRSMFPDVRVLQGDGALYWSGGMRLAFAAAMKEGFDAYILFNDDTVLYEDALERLIPYAWRSVKSGTPAIVAGSTRSPMDGATTYGGIAVIRRGLTVKFELVGVHRHSPLRCDTMHGNFALIPAEIAKVVGNIEQRFRHQFGDFDYGFRARAAGFEVMVAPGYVGECSTNPTAGTWVDPTASFSTRWKSLISPKGVPAREWFLFTRRYYGWRFPYYALSPYLKTLVRGLFRWPRKEAVRRSVQIER